MLPSLNYRSLAAIVQLTPHEVDAVLASARTLKRAAVAGRVQPLLRGKNLALICTEQAQPDAALFHRAATGLGAHVSQVRPTTEELATPADVKHTARMLGRLYDGIECQGLPADLVSSLDRDAGVPVFDGLACAQHAGAELARLLGSGNEADDRLFVLQALLVGTIE